MQSSGFILNPVYLLTHREISPFRNQLTRKAVTCVEAPLGNVIYIYKIFKNQIGKD